jgi:HAMP domain-containing protein
MARQERKSGIRSLLGRNGAGATAVIERGPEFGEGAERQLRELLEAMEAVRNGDLTRRLRKEREDIFGELAVSYNSMVDLLNNFGSEVTRVAREVGTEGKLGGQAKIERVTGTWKELTDNVNTMANNLTNQVRNIATVATGIAKGDLGQKITVEAQGEILAVKETVNSMVDNLNTFAGEVTRLAKEVGTEGKLGGQAEVPGASGIWKDLTNNVNAMANNLTDQVRNIATQTLESILPALPADFPSPVIVVQHLPNIFFTESFAKRLNFTCELTAKVAENNEVIQTGKVYLAPGGTCMTLDLLPNREITFCINKAKDDGLTPSIDLAMESAAKIFNERTIGIILSGMGNDGCLGMKAIKECGGKTIVQDESSLIFSMPKAVIDAGFADEVLPAGEIAVAMMDCAFYRQDTELCLKI